MLVLSWSRACYARFALDQTLESFLRGHVEAFAALQGIPRIILYDNLKSVVLERVEEGGGLRAAVAETIPAAEVVRAPLLGDERGEMGVVFDAVAAIVAARVAGGLGGAVEQADLVLGGPRGSAAGARAGGDRISLPSKRM